MRFKINIINPSQNIYDKWHWSKKHKFRNQCFKEVKLSLGDYTYESMPPHNLVFTRVSNRLIDPLNCYSSLKHVLDAFVFYKVIEDDSSKYINYVLCKQEKTKKGEAPHLLLDIT